MKWFKCHCCEEIIDGNPDTKVSMFLGFAWNAGTPGQVLDLCQECSYAVINKYREARNERLARAYQKRLEEWNLEKLKAIKERSDKKCQDHPQPSGGFLARVLHARAKKPKEKEFVRVVQHKSGQMEHSFSEN